MLSHVRAGGAALRAGGRLEWRRPSTNRLTEQPLTDHRGTAKESVASQRSATWNIIWVPQAPARGSGLLAFSSQAVGVRLNVGRYACFRIGTTSAEASVLLETRV